MPNCNQPKIMKSQLLILALVCLSRWAMAQSTTVTPQGATFPQFALMSTTDVTTVASPAPTQMVYNTNAAITGVGADGAGFYFWNGTNWKKLAVGPVSGGGGTFPSTTPDSACSVEPNFCIIQFRPPAYSSFGTVRPAQSVFLRRVARIRLLHITIEC
jgi:hypothetical protein